MPLLPRASFVNPSQAGACAQNLTVVQEHKQHLSGPTFIGSIVSALYDSSLIPTGYRRCLIDVFGYDASLALSSLATAKNFDPSPACLTICMDDIIGQYCRNGIAAQAFSLGKQQLLSIPGFPDFKKAGSQNLFMS